MRPQFSKDSSEFISRGISFSKENNFKKAISCFDKVLKIDAKSVVALLHKGLALRELGRNEEAIVCYDSVL
ncbi:MAG: tetratricopeptide repeat protein, partial [Nitrosopumilaceae archaeon]